MEASLALLNANIQFLDTQLSLIHIPLHLYPQFLQPILQLLLHIDQDGGSSTASRRPWAYDHPFANISITPVECSIACSRTQAQELFVPIREALDATSREHVTITSEDYIVIQVDGEGMEAGQRVLELTSPLAMAGISIFFITTYFCDYILVPLKSRSTVIRALEERAFTFEKHVNGNGGNMVNTAAAHRRATSSTSSIEVPPPATPPPATISELQTRTFATLKRRNVVPHASPDIRLLSCCGRKDGARNGSASDGNEEKLHLGLVRCLLARPRFLSLTLTDAEPASLLVEQRLLPHFDADVLLGARSDALVPIMLDLRELPLESTGIVCGVAGRLVGGTAGSLKDAVEMLFLSTARAGNVLVYENELGRALEALRGAENGIVVQPD